MEELFFPGNRIYTKRTLPALLHRFLMFSFFINVKCAHLVSPGMAWHALLRPRLQWIWHGIFQFDLFKYENSLPGVLKPNE
jgi:hypothetical protein